MGEGAGEGTRDQPPSRTGTISAPGLADRRSDLDGGDAFASEARPHPGQSSPHTLLTLPRTSRDQQQSPPSAPPTGGGGGGGGGDRDSALPTPFSTPSLPSLSREMTTIRGTEAARRHRCPHPRKVDSGHCSQILHSLWINEEDRAKRLRSEVSLSRVSFQKKHENCGLPSVVRAREA